MNQPTSSSHVTNLTSPSYRDDKCADYTLNNNQLFTFAKDWNSIPETIILNLILFFVSN